MPDLPRQMGDQNCLLRPIPIWLLGLVGAWGGPGPGHQGGHSLGRGWVSAHSRLCCKEGEG